MKKVLLACALVVATLVGGRAALDQVRLNIQCHVCFLEILVVHTSTH